MKTNKPPVFVFGRTINALTILRSIGRRGICTYLVDSEPAEIGFFSRYTQAEMVFGFSSISAI